MKESLCCSWQLTNMLNRISTRSLASLHYWAKWFAWSYVQPFWPNANICQDGETEKAPCYIPS